MGMEMEMEQEYVRHLNSVVQGEYRDRVIVVHPQLRLYTRALGVFDALKGKVEMTAPRFNVSGSCGSWWLPSAAQRFHRTP